MSASRLGTCQEHKRMQQTIKLKQWLTWWHSLSHSQGSTSRALTTVQTLRDSSWAPRVGTILTPAGDGLGHSFDFPLWPEPCLQFLAAAFRKSYGEEIHGPKQSTAVQVLPACQVFLSLARKKRKKWVSVHIASSARHGSSWGHPSYSNGSGPSGPQSCHSTSGAWIPYCCSSAS